MQIQCFKSGLLHNNNYLIWDEESKEAALIDCTEQNQKILDVIQEKGLKLKYILLTHGHFDHILGVDFFQEKTQAITYLNEADEPLLGKINLFMDMLNLPHTTPPKITHFFNNKTLFSLGQNTIKVFTTPGHSKGGCCFLIQNHLFSGDTLFANTFGRTDCWGGDPQEMQNSLKFLFQNLPDDVMIYPGHGHPSTIGQERSLYQF